MKRIIQLLSVIQVAAALVRIAWFLLDPSIGWDWWVLAVLMNSLTIIIFTN